MKPPVSVTIVIQIHCIVSRNDIVEYFFDKHPMILTDMVMLKRLGFTKWNSSIMDKPHSLNVASKAKHIKNPGKKGVGDKNSGRDDGSPSHTISQRKHFTFLNFQ